MIDKNIIYTGVIRGACSKQGLHCVSLEEGPNAFVCWHLEESVPDDPGAEWVILWHEWIRDHAIERAVCETVELRKASWKKGVGE